MMDDTIHVSPSLAPENSCRSLGFSPSTNTMIIRRKRLELRRLIRTELAGGIVIHSRDQCRKRRRRAEPVNEELAIAGKKTSAKSDNKITNEMISDGSRILSVVISKEDHREREKVNRFTYRSHGSTSVIGRRREMEDAVAIQLEFLKSGSRKYNFFGVYDGHGGSCVADACRERLHHLVAKTAEEEVEENDGSRAEKQMIDWEKVMAASFRRMDEEVTKGGSSAEMTGSTAVVAVVGEDELVVANCGDSRAVLFRGGVAVPLSHDHKPDRPDELERIEESGGKVINWNGQRVLGVLATSRSIGDNYLKPFVTAEPDVRIINRSEKDEFLILGCDGLWDVISNEFACDVVRRCLLHNDNINNHNNNNHNRRSSFDEAAKVLAKLALLRGSRDNISVIVIEL